MSRSPEEDPIDPLPPENVVEIERWIEARPETVFAYFTDPERFRRWQGEEASIEPHPGGTFRVTVGGPSGGVVRGEFMEVVAARKLVFTWRCDGITPQRQDLATLLERPSTVEISLETQGDGTLLRLRHTHELHAAQFADPQGSAVGLIKAM